MCRPNSRSWRVLLNEGIAALGGGRKTSFYAPRPWPVRAKIWAAHHCSGPAAGCQRHGQADINGRIGQIFFRISQQPEQTALLLSSTASKPDQMHALLFDASCGCLKAVVVRRGAIRIRSRRRIGLVQREPLLRLFETFVKELMVQTPGAQRFTQIALNVRRKLAFMDTDMGNRWHDILWLKKHNKTSFPVVVRERSADIPCPQQGAA